MPSARTRSSRRTLPGILPIFRAIATGGTDLDLSELDPSVVRLALQNGLGPILAHVGRDCDANARSPFADEIRAADLTARVLTAEAFDAVEDILRASAAVSCQPVLIKGAATALLYYPAPHLRTMGDIDLYVPAARQSALETQLRSLGFEQSSHRPAYFYHPHHHSMPFWHPARRVWVEVHTQLFPPESPLANDLRFSLDAITPQLRPLHVGGYAARVMSHELQLLYTCARWTEDLDPGRGAYPMLDVILLTRTRGHRLDWNHVLAMLEGSSATTAVRLMLSYLSRWGVVSAAREVLDRLAAGDQHVNRVSLWILHRLLTSFLIEGRPYGRLATSSNVRIVWSSLTQPRSPLSNLLALPCRVAFPPRYSRPFDLAFAFRRLRSVIRRAAE